MRTTAIFAEILVIGFQSLVWMTLGLVAYSEIEVKDIPWEKIKVWSSLITLMLTVLAYTVGVIVDRFADIFYEACRKALTCPLAVLKATVDRLRRKEKGRLTEVEGRALCRVIDGVDFAACGLSENEKLALVSLSEGDTGRLPSPTKEEQQMGEVGNIGRMKVLLKGGDMLDFLEYQRSRFRVARATAFNSLATTVCAFILVDTKLAQYQVLLAGGLITVLSTFAAYRISSARDNRSREALQLINEES